MNTITTREYFAARAPHEIPDWFKPEMADTPPAAPTPQIMLSERAARVWHDWRGGDFDLDAAIVDELQWARIDGDDAQELRRLQRAFDDYLRDRDAYAASVKTRRLAQWPWRWADLVLAAK